MVAEEIQQTTKVLKIGTTDVFLIDYTLGKGKIIINDDEWNIHASYYWGAMGRSISDFLLDIDVGYFVKNLGTYNSGEMNIRATMREVRKFIKTDCPLAWYMDLDFNKELRYELNRIQKSCYSKEDFVSKMQNLENSLSPRYSSHRYEAEDTISMISNEPWHFIVSSPPRENIWLGKFFPKLKSHLKII